jgi:hypothetical protein
MIFILRPTNSINMRAIKTLIEKPAKAPIAWLAITILLGGLGSGLWEYAMKPSLVWLKDGLLFVSTLGIDSFRDSLYARVANGFHEYTSQQTYNLVSGVLAGAILGFTISRRAMKHIWKRPAAAPAQTTTENAERVSSRIRWLLIYMLFFAAFFLVQSTRVTYVTNATTHIFRLVAVVSPHVTETERLTFLSRIAQIQSRKDYIAIEADLRAVANQKELFAPTFSIW